MQGAEKKYDVLVVVSARTYLSVYAYLPKYLRVLILVSTSYSFLAVALKATLPRISNKLLGYFEELALCKFEEESGLS